MVAGERSRRSDLPFAQRRNPLLLSLLSLLLLPARPALGNEGGAAGSCQCTKYRDEPPLVKRFPDRLVTWERCRGLIRFIFPKNRVCGLDDAPWVLQLISRKKDKRKGAAKRQGEGAAKVSSSERYCPPSPTSRGRLQPLSSMGPTPVVPMQTQPSQQLPTLTHTTGVALETVWSTVLPRNGEGAAKVSSSERCCPPSPTSRGQLQPLSSVGPTPVVPMETQPSQQLPTLTHTTAVALETVWSTVLPRNAGALAELSPTRFAQAEGGPGWHYQTTVLSALGIVLLLVILGLLCWWRPPRRSHLVALTSEEQVRMMQIPGGEGTYSPRAGPAAASDWGV